MSVDLRGLDPIARERRRRREREYSSSRHRTLRARFRLVVAAGLAYCARCGDPISPDEPWDLGHDDFDRSRYSGPEHARCNRGAPNKLHPSRAW